MWKRGNGCIFWDMIHDGMSASSVYLLYIQLEMVGGLAVQYSLLTLQAKFVVLILKQCSWLLLSAANNSSVMLNVANYEQIEIRQICDQCICQASSFIRV